MTIELFDIDVPYSLQIDCTDDGKDFIRVKPNSADADRNEMNDICLDYDQCQELSRVLKFISNEIKPKINDKERKGTRQRDS